jgi:hypothetical protein
MTAPTGPFVDAGVEARRVPIARTDDQMLESICQLLVEILAEVKRGNSAAREGAVSSCEIKFLANGTPQPTVKAYANSEVPVDAAIEAYGAAFRAAQAGQMTAWAETVDGLAKASAA